MKRKLFAALLAVMMVFAIVPVSVSAAGVPVSNEAELVAAVTSSSDYVNVILTADIELTSTLMILDQIDLDLNGHTISGNFESDYGTVYVGVNGQLILKDYSTEGTGKITSSASYAIGNYGRIWVYGGTYESTAEDCAALYNFFYESEKPFYGITIVYTGNFSEIWNCGELYLDYSDIGTLDNSFYVVFRDYVSVDLFIDREYVAEGYYSEVICGNSPYCFETHIKKAVDEAGNEIDFEKLYAPRVMVALELDGGTCEIPENLSIALCDSFDSLPTPTKEGYVFKGWAIKWDPNNSLPAPCLLSLDAEEIPSEEEFPEEDEDGILYIPVSEMDNAAHLSEEMVYVEYTEDGDLCYIVLKALWEEAPPAEEEPEEIVPEFVNPVPNLFTVNVVSTAGGTTNTTPTFRIALGASRTIKLIPEEGFEIAEVRINNRPVEVKNSTVSIRGARSNYLVEVFFAEIAD